MKYLIQGNNIETVYDVEELEEIGKKLFIKSEMSPKLHKYCNIYSTFDIETTKEDEYHTFMYHAQFCVGGYVFFMRTWDEVVIFLDSLTNIFNLSENKKMIIYVHNLSYEFQFIRNFISIISFFAISKREIIKFDTECFEFRCSYKLSNKSLEKLCKSFDVKHKKMKGDLDYLIYRDNHTLLNDEESMYCFNDVMGLYECIEVYLKDDTLETIPLTSTGFVRRDFRKAVTSNEKNREIFLKGQLDPYMYLLLKTARRGGDTSASAYYSDKTLLNVSSKDKKSSYPYEMMTKKYPIGQYCEIKDTDLFWSYRKDMSCILKVTFYDIKLIDVMEIPYIPRAKCMDIRKCLVSNGRVLKAEKLSMALTEVDMEIILSMYTFKNIEIHELFISDKDYLPKEFRECLMQYFYKKCELESGDPYEYMKVKNKINASFGMMLTDICRVEYYYKDGSDCYGIKELDTLKKLMDYYRSRNNFLSYQHGIYVTAYARKSLQTGAKKIIGDEVYRDTDSLKYLNNHEKEFIELNKEIIDEAETFDVKPYVDYNGKRIYLGVWESDASYKKFRTLGAKKYAYEDESGVHVTVAGLSKEKGALYLSKMGGIDYFKDKLEFPAEYSGRMSAFYTDLDSPYSYINRNGNEIITGSCITLTNVTYTLDRNVDYKKIVENIKNGIDIADIVI